MQIDPVHDGQYPIGSSFLRHVVAKTHRNMPQGTVLRRAAPDHTCESIFVLQLTEEGGDQVTTS